MSFLNLIYNTVTQVILEYNILDVGQSLFDRRCLGNNINTVTILFDHILKPSDLTLNNFQSPSEFCLIYAHSSSIPPRGYTLQDPYLEFLMYATF